MKISVPQLIPSRRLKFWGAEIMDSLFNELDLLKEWEILEKTNDEELKSTNQTKKTVNRKQQRKSYKSQKN